MRHRILFLAIVCLFIIACASQQSNTYKVKGVYHSVKKGETISDIARAYNTNPGKLAEINHIKSPGRLEENSVVFIPDAVQVLDIEKPPKSGIKNQQPQGVQKKTQTGKKASSPSLQQELKPRDQGKKIAAAVSPGGKKPVRERTGGTEKEKPIDAQPPQPPAGVSSAEKGSFAWPVRGRVTANFGRQPNGMVNNHIRITARDHAPVVAAATGTVIFSAPLRDFGETIIIKHDNQFATVYSNLGNRSVKADSRIKKSEIIGLAGKSEKKGEGYIDFEIRQNNKARNPLLFLP
ncbi:MAG: M23 family metallopeptidase [Deltaproteobacteria bacterium]|nr:M23 family metallopeptidase [Deltaproteobacteria bacterium]